MQIRPIKQITQITQITKQPWGRFKDQDIWRYTLTSQSGAIIKLSNYGARIVSIQVPDNKGQIGHVVLGFDNLTPFLEDKHYMGATMGRFANRIANAQFPLSGQNWTLEANEGRHCNHSGSAGFDHQVFEAELFDSGVIFYLSDPHGSGGFPGNINLSIRYELSEEPDTCTLKITYEGVSDRPAILNLTNHAYFNLSGGHQDCLAHRLEILACRQLELDADHLPTGRWLPVVEKKGNTTKDHAGNKEPRTVIRAPCTNIAESSSKSIEIKGRQLLLQAVKGLNSCFELEGYKDQQHPRRNNNIDEDNDDNNGHVHDHDAADYACRLMSDDSGRQLDIRTSYPGLLVYTGYALHSKATGFFGRPYRPFDGLAIECQYYPDSPNQPEFPSVVIQPGSPYHEYIEYCFGTYQPSKEKKREKKRGKRRK